jgi:hypothetical protein
MGNGIEIVRQISINYLTGSSFQNTEMDAAQRHFGIYPSPETILPSKQVRFEDRTDHEQYSHLHNTVTYARYP